MSKFEGVLEKAKNQLEACGVEYDEVLLTKVAKALGPSIYNRDSSTVAFGNKGEVETLRKNFVGKKLGITDEAAIDQAMESVKEKMSAARTKQRINVYYMLVKELGKESVYA